MPSFPLQLCRRQLVGQCIQHCDGLVPPRMIQQPSNGFDVSRALHLAHSGHLAARVRAYGSPTGYDPGTLEKRRAEANIPVHSLSRPVLGVVRAALKHPYFPSVANKPQIQLAWEIHTPRFACLEFTHGHALPKPFGA